MLSMEEVLVEPASGKGVEVCVGVSVGGEVGDIVLVADGSGTAVGDGRAAGLAQALTINPSQAIAIKPMDLINTDFIP
jgi:hypothetical protein